MDTQQKNRGGRPTKYGPHVIPTAEKYYEQYKSHQTLVPFMEELELELRITRETRNQWMKKYPDFAYVIGLIKLLQQVRLMERCIYSRKHPRRFIFLLKTLHGMREYKKLDPTPRTDYAN